MNAESSVLFSLKVFKKSEALMPQEAMRIINPWQPVSAPSLSRPATDLPDRKSKVT
jgi:hypothetical protein